MRTLPRVVVLSAHKAHRPCGQQGRKKKRGGRPPRRSPPNPLDLHHTVRRSAGHLHQTGPEKAPTPRPACPPDPPRLKAAQASGLIDKVPTPLVVGNPRHQSRMCRGSPSREPHGSKCPHPPPRLASMRPPRRTCTATHRPRSPPPEPRNVKSSVPSRLSPPRVLHHFAETCGLHRSTGPLISWCSTSQKHAACIIDRSAHLVARHAARIVVQVRAPRGAYLAYITI